MKNYLGETVVDIATHPTYSKYTPADWAMVFITRLGGFEGRGHQQWLIDQVARILKGTPVIVKKASWDNGHSEYRYTLDAPSAEYNAWVEYMLGEKYEDGSREYDWSTGICP